MPSTVQIPIHCWVVCEEHREEAQNAGYDSLVKILGSLGDDAVDIQAVAQLNTLVAATASSVPKGKLLIVGHRADLRKAKLSPLQQSDVLELHFITIGSPPFDTADGSVSHQKVPYCSIRELCFCLPRALKEDFGSQDKLNEFIATHRAEARRSLLDPLLPLAVLADGFPTPCPEGGPGWFEPGINAAIEGSSSAIYPVTSDEYWKRLAKDGPAIDHLRGMLREPAKATPGFDAVIAEARRLWVDTSAEHGEATSEADLVYKHAYDAVKALWDVLKPKDGVPAGGAKMELRTLVEAASVGFYVLAAGHL